MSNIREFIEYLNRYTLGGYRLPTAIEWERAAKSGVPFDYHFGDNLKYICDFTNVRDVAWYSDYRNRHPTRAPKIINSHSARIVCADGFVGPNFVDDPFFKSNTYGLYHMLGNVSEYTSDCHVDSNTPTEDSEFGCMRYVVKGGNAYLHASDSSAFRFSSVQQYSINRDNGKKEVKNSRGEFLGADRHIGFRLARDLNFPALSDLMSYAIKAQNPEDFDN